MRLPAVMLAIGSALVSVSPSPGQTPEIQKQIQQKLEEMRKDQRSLQDLLSQALKNNADIRVAEAKVREAEAELHRTRVTVLNKIAMLQQEIKSAKAAADEATSRFERDVELSRKQLNALSAAELSASRAAMMKFKADLAVVEAQLDGLVGKHAEKTGEWKRLFDMGVAPMNKEFMHPVPKEPPPLAAAVPAALAEKIRKALDTPFKISAKGEMAPSEVLDLLRQETKGINVLGRVEDTRPIPRLNLSESVPLGAVYQWAEDQLDWRFLVRDYGIVVTPRNAVPPGAILLLDFWRQGRATTAPK
jgi:hypothetical protein